MRDVLRDNSVPSSDLCAGEGAAQSKDTAGRKVKGVDSVDSEAGWREGGEAAHIRGVRSRVVGVVSTRSSPFTAQLLDSPCTLRDLFRDLQRSGCGLKVWVSSSLPRLLRQQARTLTRRSGLTSDE